MPFYAEVAVKLLSSTGRALVWEVSYYAKGWKKFGIHLTKRV